MATELELKTVIVDPEAFRATLAMAGATRTFRGMMHDRRLDAAGALTARNQVLRVRTYQPGEPSAATSGGDRCGAGPAVLSWKGNAGVSGDGYKHCEELECLTEDGGAALALFGALGYETVHAIDRFIEVYQLTGAVVRLEWYPRMDVLAEIEGGPVAMEAAIEALGLERAACLPDGLPVFATRFEARTGQPAVLNERELGGGTPSWRTR